MKLRPSAPPVLPTIRLKRAEKPVGLVAPTAGKVRMPRELFTAGVSSRTPPFRAAAPDTVQPVGRAPAEKSWAKRLGFVSSG